MTIRLRRVILLSLVKFPPWLRRVVLLPWKKESVSWSAAAAGVKTNFERVEGKADGECCGVAWKADRKPIQDAKDERQPNGRTDGQTFGRIQRQTQKKEDKQKGYCRMLWMKNRQTDRKKRKNAVERNTVWTGEKNKTRENHMHIYKSRRKKY